MAKSMAAHLFKYQEVNKVYVFGGNRQAIVKIKELGFQNMWLKPSNMESADDKKQAKSFRNFHN